MLAKCSQCYLQALAVSLPERNRLCALALDKFSRLLLVSKIRAEEMPQGSTCSRPKAVLLGQKHAAFGVKERKQKCCSLQLRPLRQSRQHACLSGKTNSDQVRTLPVSARTLQLQTGSFRACLLS